MDWTAPILPLHPAPAERRSHDHPARHGTSTLFAALNVATGQVIGACKPDTGTKSSSPSSSRSPVPTQKANCTW
ncbi:hypothetical protein [Streptomyces sp. NPDC058394]|uniref:hypothetical protein n=1 Tax=unclassified Streptomyces TaxID=2593676 RepID=UPI00365BB6D5